MRKSTLLSVYMAAASGWALPAMRHRIKMDSRLDEIQAAIRDDESRKAKAEAKRKRRMARNQHG